MSTEFSNFSLLLKKYKIETPNKIDEKSSVTIADIVSVTVRIPKYSVYSINGYYDLITIQMNPRYCYFFLLVYDALLTTIVISI